MSVASYAQQSSLGDIKDEEEPYYGELVVIKEDKSQGDAFEIVEDVRIGREKSSDIRVNLKTVSRSHAVVMIDVNGRASLTNFSSTNPTILNGVQLEGKECSTLLEHGDIFTIGERDFMYRNENLLYEQQQCNNKHIQTLETIGEENSQNISVSRNNSMSIAGTPGSVNKSPGKPKSSAKGDQPKLSPKEVLRRLKTPIREAINDRRISFGANQVQEAPVSDEPKTEAEAGAQEPIKMVKRVLKTPIREAIQARRKSLGVLQTETTVTVAMEAGSTEAKLRKLKTPLREAIHARRKSLGAAAVVKETAAPEPDEKDPVPPPPQLRTLKTPLKEAIHARRKSISALRSAAKAAKQQQLQLSDCRDLIIINMPSSRRASLASGAVSPDLSVEDVQMNISMNEDRRVSAAGTEYATWDLDVTHNMSIASAVTSSSKSLPDFHADETALEGDELDTLVEASVTKIAIDAMAVEFERNGDANSAAAAYSLAEEVFMMHPELFSAKFCSEEDEKVCPPSPMVGQYSQEEMVALASSSATPKKAKASPAPPSPMVGQYSQEEMVALASSCGSAVKAKTGDASLPSPALKLVNSLEKRGEKNVLDLDVELLDQESSNLISQLTDNEMFVIDNYALMLEEGGKMDTDEAYATALDAYLRGLQVARKRSPFSPVQDMMVSPFSPLPETTSLEGASEDFPSKSVVEAEAESVKSGPSTPAKKDSPRSTSSSVQRADIEMVDKYMYLIMCEAHVSEGIAYGMSLDAYLADKALFRAHVSHLLDSAAEAASKLPYSGTPLSALKMGALSSPAVPKRSAVKTDKKRRSLAVSFVGNAFASAMDDTLAGDGAAVTPTPILSKRITTGRKKLQMRTATPHGKVTTSADFDAIMDNIASAVKRMVLAGDEEEEREAVEEETIEEETAESAKKATPAARSIVKSASKTCKQRKGLAMSLVGDAVQSALACIANNNDGKAQSPVNVPFPASVSKSSHKREAFTELVQSLASAVDQAVDVDDYMDEDEAQPVSRNLRLSTSPAFVKSHVKRRDLASSLVGDAVQVALESLIQPSAASGEHSPAADDLHVSAQQATKSAQKDAIVSLVENLALAVEAAEAAEIVLGADEAEDEVADQPLTSQSKSATPDMGTTVPEKRTKLVAKRSAKKPVKSPAKSTSKSTPVSPSPKSTDKASATPKKAKASPAPPSPMVGQYSQEEMVALASSCGSAVKPKKQGGKKGPKDVVPLPSAPAVTPKKVGTRTKRTKAMKSPMPSADSPAACLPTKRARGGNKAPSKAEKEQPVPEPAPIKRRATAAKKSNIPTAKASSKAKGRAATRRVEDEEGVPEEMEDAMAILCDGCDAEHFLDDVGLSEVPEGDWFCAKCEAKNAKAAKKAPARKAPAKKAAAEPAAGSRRSTRTKK